MVTLALCLIHGRVMMGGGVESTSGVSVEVLVGLRSSSLIEIEMMSPDDGIWMV